MADYYPLIARAVESLSDNAPQTRRAVYDRARTALQEQLRAVDPPLSEADIARERLSLDRAIDRVEAEQRPAKELETALPQARAEARDGGSERPAFPGETAPDRRAGLADDALAEPRELPRERPRVEARGPAEGDRGRLRALALGIALAVVIGAIAVVAWLLRDSPPEVRDQAPPVAAAPQPEPDAKVAERAPGAPPPGPSGASGRGDLAVAQRAILYEENQADPQTPKATAGRAVWRLDNLNAGRGEPLETVVRATVEIQGGPLTLSLLIRRNTDPTLPASHTIELTFTTAPGEPGRVIRDIGLLQLKNEEAVRGTPLAGLPVPVKDNVFLIGLSNLQGDTERNVDLLRTRNWIDLPIRMASGQRAILSFEKGVSGEQVVSEAVNQWR